MYTCMHACMSVCMYVPSATLSNKTCETCLSSQLGVQTSLFPLFHLDKFHTVEKKNLVCKLMIKAVLPLSKNVSLNKLSLICSINKINCSFLHTICVTLKCHEAYIDI